MEEPTRCGLGWAMPCAGDAHDLMLVTDERVRLHARCASCFMMATAAASKSGWTCQGSCSNHQPANRLRCVLSPASPPTARPHGSATPPWCALSNCCASADARSVQARPWYVMRMLPSGLPQCVVDAVTVNLVVPWLPQVECDVCKEWYHPPCVGGTRALGDLPTYKCPMCTFLYPDVEPGTAPDVDDPPVDRRTLMERFAALPDRSPPTAEQVGTLAGDGADNNDSDVGGAGAGADADADADAGGGAAPDAATVGSSTDDACGWLCSACEGSLDQRALLSVQESHREVRPPAPFDKSYQWVFEVRHVL